MKSRKIIIGLGLLISFMLLALFPWWFWGTIKEFKDWYPRIGLILWLLKLVLGGGVLLGTLYYVRFIPFKKLASVYLFFVFIISSWLIGEQHPFSRYPMYNSFPNYAYIFVLENKQNEHLPLIKYSRLNSAEISHLYFSALKKNQILEYGMGVEDDFVDRLNIGEEMFEQIKWKETKDSLSCLKLSRIFLKIESGKLLKQEKTLYESCL